MSKRKRATAEERKYLLKSLSNSCIFESGADESSDSSILETDADDASSSCQSMSPPSLSTSPISVTKSGRSPRTPTTENKNEKSERICDPVCKFFGVSRRGYAPHVKTPKKNQDRQLSFHDTQTNSFVQICLDGHGTYGDLCAQFIRDRLEGLLTSHQSFATDLKLAIVDSIIQCEHMLLKEPSIDTSMSGSTLCMAVIRGNLLTVANIGDSRVIVGYRDQISGDIKTQRVSIDHKPESPEEMARIVRCEGRVASIQYPDGELGPPRVWKKDNLIPGLAMSRSLGDEVAHKIGVISTPDIFERDLDASTDCLLIVATDGLWQYMEDEMCVEESMKHSDPATSAMILISMSNERWLAREQYIDDTTVCVSFLAGKESELR